MGVWQRFKADQNGATAVMFGLSVLPIMGLMGAAVDYSRASSVTTELQRAVDATAIALVREPAGESNRDFASKAQALFDTVYHAPGYVALNPVTVSRNGKAIQVAANGTVTNAFLQIAGLRDTHVGATASSVSGTQKIELALVLDNTGSMNDRIGSQRKIDALKDQAKKLLARLRSAATDTDSVKVSIVPFDTEVRLDPNAYRYQSTWFSWKGGTYKSWSGYVYDRANSYATSDDAPTPSIPDSLFPVPVKSQWGSDLATVRPLTSLYGKTDYDALTAVVDGMQPRGNTDIALGTIWGLATLSPGEPFTEGAAFSDTSVKKFLVVLTDGLNTEYHDSTGQPNATTSDIDANTRAACQSVKAKQVEVFTIRLLDGNAGLLQSCATDAGHYSDVKNATDLGNAFDKISSAIVGTRLTH